MRQCEIVAVEKGARKSYEEAKSTAYQRLGKPEPLAGLARKYEPLKDGDEELPPQRQLVQVRVPELLDDIQKAVINLCDTVATKDYGNCIAKADVEVDGQILIKDCPVTHLLWLEQQLVDMHTVLEKLPALDLAEEWDFDKNSNCYATDPVKTARNVKVKEAFVLAPATDKHPAQTQLIEKEVLAGYWTTTKFSGCLPATRIKQLKARCAKLQAAVRVSREKANATEIKKQTYGQGLMNWLFAD